MNSVALLEKRLEFAQGKKRFPHTQAGGGTGAETETEAKPAIRRVKKQIAQLQIALTH